MGDKAGPLTLLSAMITPAVLISACGTLIFSTSTRLSRIVDRVRALGQEMEELSRRAEDTKAAARRADLEQQLRSRAQRGRLIQRSLASLYISLGLFVGATMGIALTGFFPGLGWMPTALGVAGTLALFNGSVL